MERLAVHVIIMRHADQHCVSRHAAPPPGRPPGLNCRLVRRGASRYKGPGPRHFDARIRSCHEPSAAAFATAALAAAFLALALPAARGQAYWDPGHTGSFSNPTGSGGNGTWDATAVEWYNFPAAPKPPTRTEPLRVSPARRAPSA